MDSIRKITLYNIKNKTEFFKVVDQCQGQVYLKTQDGDVLNLKSKLCQYVTTLDVFQGDVIGDFEIECTNNADLGMILEFLMKG